MDKIEANFQKDSKKKDGAVSLEKWQKLETTIRELCLKLTEQEKKAPKQKKEPKSALKTKRESKLTVKSEAKAKKGV